MCVAIIVDGEECDMLNDLCERLSTPPLYLDGSTTDDTNKCLCFVDVSGMALVAGAKCKALDDVWISYEITTKGEPESAIQ